MARTSNARNAALDMFGRIINGSTLVPKVFASTKGNPSATCELNAADVVAPLLRAFVTATAGAAPPSTPTRAAPFAPRSAPADKFPFKSFNRTTINRASAFPRCDTPATCHTCVSTGNSYVAPRDLRSSTNAALGRPRPLPLPYPTPDFFPPRPPPTTPPPSPFENPPTSATPPFCKYPTAPSSASNGSLSTVASTRPDMDTPSARITM